MRDRNVFAAISGDSEIGLSPDFSTIFDTTTRLIGDFPTTSTWEKSMISRRSRPGLQIQLFCGLGLAIHGAHGRGGHSSLFQCRVEI